MILLAFYDTCPVDCAYIVRPRLRLLPAGTAPAQIMSGAHMSGLDKLGGAAQTVRAGQRPSSLHL